MTSTSATRSLGAGEAALHKGAWTEARRHFTSALRVRESPDALEGLGWAEWWLDKPRASFTARERAYQLYRKRGDRRAAARVAMALAVDYIDYRGEPAVGRGWIERSRRLLEGLEQTPEYGWALMWQGHWARMIERNPTRAAEFGAQAAALARQLEMIDLEMLAEALQGLALIDLGRRSDGFSRLDEAMAAAMSGEMTELDAIGQTCCFLIHACRSVHDLDRVVQWCSQVKEFCRRWRIKSVFTICRTNYAAVLIVRGDLGAAERELRQAAREPQTRPYVARAAWVQLGELRRRQGRTAEAHRLFERAAGHPLAVLGQAWLAEARGDWSTAAEYAERFTRLVAGDIPMEVAVALELRIHALVAAGRVNDAEEPFQTLCGLVTRLDIAAMRALRKSAEASIATGKQDSERARRFFLESADLFTQAQMPYEAAAARERASQALSATPTSIAKPAPITSRERDVLRLVAQGLSDRRMAARLKLSEHTIHRHVSNILTKLGASSRSAAVAQAVRSSLI